MSFVSFQFPFFFLLVSAGVYLIPGGKRWIWLLLASCWFYMAFVPAYILILFALIAIDYTAGLWIEKSEGSRRRWILIASLVANVGLLASFKYLNFGIGNFNQAAAALGLGSIAWSFPFLLPIGLSFHTFQSMAYTIEVYKRRQKAERHLGLYSLYVLYYPQMVAGPIERPQNILPQLHAPTRATLDDWSAGLQLMVWGLFKKVVVADRLAAYVDSVYSRPGQLDPGEALLAAYFFAFQIYCDFSGYTDIARGAARTMGIHLMRNFDFPYASRSPAEFWRRWHISLSTWFRDYLFIPLGGNRIGLASTCANLLIVFVVSGLWHGAAWTFIAWGSAHGLLVVGQRVANSWSPAARLLKFWGASSVGKASQVVLTFHVVVLAWCLFRAQDMGAAWGHLAAIGGLDRASLLHALFRPEALFAIGLVAILEGVQFLHRIRSFRERFDAMGTPLRWGLWYALLVGILIFGKFGNEQFIYFQF